MEEQKKKKTSQNPVPRRENRKILQKQGDQLREKGVTRKKGEGNREQSTQARSNLRGKGGGEKTEGEFAG